VEQEMTAQLIKVRFLRINADIGKDPKLISSGGQLKIESSIGLKENESNIREAVAQVTLQVTGIPNGASDYNNFAFKIDIIVHGLYEWPTGKRPRNLKDQKLMHLLCAPLYPLAVAEATNIAPRIGFNGVVIPWEFMIEKPPQAAMKKSKKSAPSASVVATRRKPVAKNQK